VSAPLRVTVAESAAAVPKDAWNAVVGQEPAPVVRWEWLHALEASGSATVERGWQAKHLCAWRGERLVGLAPAWLKFHSMGEYVYDFAWAEVARSMGLRYYPKLLVGVPLAPLTARRFHALPGEDEAAIHRALLARAQELVIEEAASSLHVIFPPEEEATALEASGLFRRASLQYHWRNPGYRDYADYLSRFDSKRRHQLKRERAAAEQQGLSLRTIRSHELRPEHGELAWRFYEATARRHAWGPIQLTRDFFHRLFATLPEAIELVVAERGTTVVAGAFNLFGKKRLWGRYWGCFEEHPFLHFNVCLYHSIDDCIRRGLEVFEPGAGGEHKIARGFEPTRIHSAHAIADAQLETAVRRACRREAEEVERLVEESEAIAGMKPWAARP
jgi:predicted N-acyltransferase